MFFRLNVDYFSYCTDIITRRALQKRYKFEPFSNFFVHFRARNKKASFFPPLQNKEGYFICSSFLKFSHFALYNGAILCYN